MKLIGYVKPSTTADNQGLVFANIQEIAAVRSDWGAGDHFEIQASTTLGAMTRVYIIRLADKNNKRGFKLFETQEEANAFLDTMMSSAINGVIDLRRIGDFYAVISDRIPTVCITNDWDEFTDSEEPIVVRIAKIEEM